MTSMRMTALAVAMGGALAATIIPSAASAQRAAATEAAVTEPAATEAAVTEPAATEPAATEEIIVTGEFREADALELPRNISVLDEAALESATVQHFEEATLLVPNLNWSGEGSRGRYFQLRGIGELEQYDGAPNPSVGFLIDDIDFSSIGAVATLFDVERVEVLRGPQGTRYGANALGGLVYMRSAAPTDELAARFELTAGSDDTQAFGAAVGGPMGERSGYRVSVHRYSSHGFRDNAWLGRDDTAGRDELVSRAKLRFEPSERVAIEATGLYFDMDNGYDGWSIFNGYDVQSDRPGRDAQRSLAGSLRVTAELDRFDLVSITGVNSTDAQVSFDADWGNPELWSPVVYDFFSLNERDRDTRHQELRFLSKPGALANGRGDWLFGVYALELDEANVNVNEGVLDDGVFEPWVLDDRTVSDYEARNIALFGQIDIDVAPRARFTAGLRWERRTASYADTNGNAFAPEDRMLGGELAIAWTLDEHWMTYARLARGYKAGGFNTSFAGVDFDDVDGVTAEQIEFGAEALWSLESGVKGTFLDGRLLADIGVFHARRDDQQIKIPLQLRLGDPSSFLFLTENAEEGRLQGAEASVEWRVTPRFTLGGTLGLLDAQISRFSLYPSLEGREPAHAPRASYSISAHYREPRGWFARVDIAGREDFYFDYSHDERAEAYSLVNLRVGREFGRWNASLWARNVFDETYATRGFFFGNEPPDFPERQYIRLGDPRHVGFSITLNL